MTDKYVTKYDETRTDEERRSWIAKVGAGDPFLNRDAFDRVSRAVYNEMYKRYIEINGKQTRVDDIAGFERDILYAYGFEDNERAIWALDVIETMECAQGVFYVDIMMSILSSFDYVSYLFLPEDRVDLGIDFLSL